MAGDELELVLSETEDAMKKSLGHLRADLKKVRTGRASLALFEGMTVDYYGAPTPLEQVAALSIPDSKQVVIQPWEAKSIPAIEKAILKSDLGLTPINDGKVVRIPIPALTEERRKELVKHVKKVAEDHKLGVRDARRDAVAALKSFESGGDLPADDRRRGEKQVQDLTDAHVKQIDQQAEAKEQEILQV